MRSNSLQTSHDTQEAVVYLDWTLLLMSHVSFTSTGWCILCC